jgi:PKD repeat protein
MLRAWKQNKTTFLGVTPILALALVLVAIAPASPASAQIHCTEWVDTLLDTTNNCVSEPWRPRASDVDTFRWKGHDYVIFNRGNELSIYNVDDPKNPTHTATSDFDFGTRGDSDYDLVDFDVCDDCRFGVLAHKVKRTVVFDLGAAGTPSFPLDGYFFYDGVDIKIGGYVFAKGGQEYLVSATGPGTCSGSNFYTVDGVNNLGFIGCVEVGGSGLLVHGMHEYDTGAAFYVFAAASNGPAHVFRADGAGAGLTLNWVNSPVGMFGRRYELSIDRKNALLASANLNEAEILIWDIADPENPARLWTFPAQASNVSLRSPSAGSVPTLMTNIPGWPNSTRTFTVETSGPEEFEAAFWTDPSLPHNDLPVCAFAAGGALSPDGSVLFLSRYAIHQIFDLSDCLAPSPAVADLVVTPEPAFPGDTVTVRDTTTGRVDRWAVWITEEPSGALVAGSTNPSATNPHVITYQIPQNLTWDRSYRAHIVVESDDLPPTLPAFDTDISINRTPAATISVTPSTVVVGESVTLAATAEGNPDTNPYVWTIDPPQSSIFYHDGASTMITLDEAGVWKFYLTVDYQHGTAAGGAYQATAEITDFNVTSVAADFTISPASPLHTQDISLDGSISKPVGGNLSYAWTVEEFSGSGTYTGCPAAAVCTIPGGSLLPDTWYTVGLTATNNDDEATSSLSQNVLVGNGNIQPTISFSPTSPEIGTNVIFTILGVPGDIDKASWVMGGSGCEGVDPTPECVLPDYFDCKAQAYKYSSGGNKTVSLTVEVGSNTFTADSVPVSVAWTGSCDGGGGGGGGGGGCAYVLPRTSANFGPNGGESTFGVTAGVGCPWTAHTTFPWITVLSPTGSVTGDGTVRYRVDENTGPERIGTIIAGGLGFIVTQEAPWAAANFTMSTSTPEIGEVMTFTVDPVLEIASWDFGADDCRGNDGFIGCTFLPGGTCNTMQWTYPSSGPKTVTMVLVDGRELSKIPTVQTKGECCLADARPDAHFTASADEVYTGEEVVFTDTSSKATAKAAETVGFTWDPTVPEIGESVTFEIVGVTGDVTAEWDFGGPGCGGVNQVQTCIPLFSDCHSFSHSYSLSGDTTVSLTVKVGGSVIGTATNTVTIANTGTCDDGGGGGCNYTLSAYSASFPPAGGSGSFDVNTTAECAWDVTEASSWVTIDSGEGPGPGSVDYTVAANGSLLSRSAIIRVEGTFYRVTQGADQGNTAPTAWQWTATRVEDEEGNPINEDVAAGSEQNFSHVFADPGLHRVSLTASNCFGSDSTLDYITVEEAPVEDFVVGAAVSLDGAYDTRWESDLRFYNPCGENLDVRIEYEPENTDNTGADLVFREFALGPDETRVFADITEAIPALEGEESTGSVRIESQSDSGCKVLSVSRTFNDTPDGSLGLFVPAMPVKRVGREFLDLTGLIQSEDFRTNLRLVNYGDQEVWIPITAYDKGGHQVGEMRSAMVRGHSTKQLNEIGFWLGLESDPDPFSVRVGVEGYDVQAIGTVVDNISGDSVLYLSSFHNENRIWLAGVASLAGLNDSQWRTDLWLYNPTGDWLAGQVEFVVGDSPDDVYGFEWPNLSTHRTKQYLDIVSDKLNLEETRGYIVLTGADGGPAPQVAARTYNLDAETGGTFGLNLQSFASDDLLYPGETGYITGVSNSADLSVGFRTNIGLLNTDRDSWTGVRITLYDIFGVQAAEPFESNIAPGKLWQFDVFRKLGLRDVTMTGSIKVEVTSGGGVAVYATEIDNRNQDSIFIPAQRKFQGLALQ